MPSPNANFFGGAIKKVIKGVVITASASLLARLRIGNQSLAEVVDNLSLVDLLILTIEVFGIWLAVNYLESFAKKLSSTAQRWGEESAVTVSKFPETLSREFARARDAVVALLTRLSFDGRYRRRLREDYAVFNENSKRGTRFGDTSRLDLDDVYVELQVKPHDASARVHLLQRPVVGRKTIWDFMSAVRPGKGLVLIGAPGSGKTTLLQHLLLTYAANRQGRHNQRRLLPVLIELRKLCEHIDDLANVTLSAAVRACWRKDHKLADLMSQEPEKWLEKRMSSSRALVMLDGLDEVPESRRKGLSLWIQAQMRVDTNRYCVFIITSRPGGYADAPLVDATTLILLPFSQKQSDKFIDSWYAATEIVKSGGRRTPAIRRRAARQAIQLKQLLLRHTDLSALSVNPLLLTMLCTVHENKGVLPRSRSQLYEEICQVLFESWPRDKEQALSVIRPLAAQYMRCLVRELPETTVASIITEPMVRTGYSGSAGDYLRLIQAKSGLLLEKEAGAWAFAHKTFQEYLTSEHWLRTPSALPQWPKVVSDVWWRETLLLYAARTDASSIVEAALNDGSAPAWSLAFQCLIEAQAIDPAVRERVARIVQEAYKSEDMSLFIPAVRAFHFMNQKETRRISGSVLQRVKFVTNAEYQLFLQDAEDDKGAALAPLHWHKMRYQGLGDSPVLGVLFWQAAAFARWADRVGSSSHWRLPENSDRLEVPDKSVRFWCSQETLSSAHWQAARHGDGPALPDGLRGLLSEYAAPIVRGAFQTELSGEHTFPQRTAETLARVLEVILPVAFGLEHDKQKLKGLASRSFGIGFSFIEEETTAWTKKLALCLVTYLRRAWPPDLSRSDDTTVRDDALDTLRRVALEDDDPVAVRSGWLLFSAKIMRVALPQLRLLQELGEPMVDIVRAIDVLERRLMGLARPCEGILLVRDASDF